MRIKSLMHAPIPCIIMTVICSIIPATCTREFDLSQGGSGTEIGNPAVTGKVVDAQGAPAGNVLVTIRPAGFDPVTDGPAPDSDMATTGADGIYRFLVAKDRAYTVEAVHKSRRTRALIADLLVGEADNSAPPCTLNAPGVVKVMLPENADTARGFVFIPGTSIFTTLKFNLGFVLLDSVAAGLIPQIAYSSTNGAAVTALRYKVAVTAGDTAVVGNPGWNYSREITLNTTATGANVAGNVTNFPVLIRLTVDNFDFTQARNNGEDIRFTKQDNAFLPYEIERWDAIGKKAEIWVKVDTVYGNDSARAMSMYWGNIDASAQSDPAAVFDTANGFMGVWHLGEQSGTRAGEATYNGFSGAYMGGLPEAVNGPFSICQKIGHPYGDYIDMGNVLNPDRENISMGIWAKRDSSGILTLIAKSNGNTPSAAYGYLFAVSDLNLPYFYMASGGAQWGDSGSFDMAGNLAITDTTTWHYLFAVIDRSDNGRCRMYLDGIDRTGAVRGNVTGVADVANAANLRIGIESDNDYPFKGALGEATIAFGARSADWVKLSYMNQKERDALVKWR